MKPTQTILNILRVDYYTYDNLRHHHFIDWCYRLSQKYFLPLQLLTKHDGLLNFYHDEWHSMVEKRICHSLQDYIEAGVMSKKDMLDWIYLEAEEIQNIEPMPIIKMLKKQYKNQRITNTNLN